MKEDNWGVLCIVSTMLLLSFLFAAAMLVGRQ